jgi:hypothetical protein
MKVKVYQSDMIMNENCDLVDIHEKHVLDVVGTAMDGGLKIYRCKHKESNTIVVLYPDEVYEVLPKTQIDDRELSEKVKQAVAAKSERMESEKKQIQADEATGLRPCVGDEVQYSISNKNGDVLQTYNGKVLDVNYVNARHIMYVVSNEQSLVHQVVMHHPQGWYSGDKIQKLSSLNKAPEVSEEPIVQKEIDYFAIYDTLHELVIMDSIYKYKEDADEHLNAIVTPSCSKYLRVRPIKITVL